MIRTTCKEAPVTVFQFKPKQYSATKSRLIIAEPNDYHKRNPAKRVTARLQVRGTQKITREALEAQLVFAEFWDPMATEYTCKGVQLLSATQWMRPEEKVEEDDDVNTVFRKAKKAKCEVPAVSTHTDESEAPKKEEDQSLDLDADMKKELEDLLKETPKIDNTGIASPSVIKKSGNSKDNTNTNKKNDKK